MIKEGKVLTYSSFGWPKKVEVKVSSLKISLLPSLECNPEGKLKFEDFVRGSLTICRLPVGVGDDAKGETKRVFFLLGSQ